MRLLIIFLCFITIGCFGQIDKDFFEQKALNFYNDSLFLKSNPYSNVKRKRVFYDGKILAENFNKKHYFDDFINCVNLKWAPSDELEKKLESFLDSISHQKELNLFSNKDYFDVVLEVPKRLDKRKKLKYYIGLNPIISFRDKFNLSISPKINIDGLYIVMIREEKTNFEYGMDHWILLNNLGGIIKSCSWGWIR